MPAKGNSHHPRREESKNIVFVDKLPPTPTASVWGIPQLPSMVSQKCIMPGEARNKLKRNRKDKSSGKGWLEEQWAMLFAFLSKAVLIKSHGLISNTSNALQVSEQ